MNNIMRCMTKEDLDTPCLLVDFDIMERNIRKMAKFHFAGICVPYVIHTPFRRTPLENTELFSHPSHAKQLSKIPTEIL